MDDLILETLSQFRTGVFPSPSPHPPKGPDSYPAYLQLIVAFPLLFTPERSLRFDHPSFQRPVPPPLHPAAHRGLKSDGALSLGRVPGPSEESPDVPLERDRRRVQYGSSFPFKVTFQIFPEEHPARSQLIFVRMLFQNGLTDFPDDNERFFWTYVEMSNEN